MKKVKYYVLLSLVFGAAACHQNVPLEENVDMSAEMAIIKKISNTLTFEGNEDIFSEAYADSAKLYWNSLYPLSPEEALIGIDLALEPFTDMRFLDGRVYQVIETENGESWTGSWRVREGRVKNSEVVVHGPVHFISRFENGKIVEESGFWDNQILNHAIEKAGYYENI